MRRTKLIASRTSPYARKVRVLLAEKRRARVGRGRVERGLSVQAITPPPRHKSPW